MCHLADPQTWDYKKFRQPPERKEMGKKGRVLKKNNLRSVCAGISVAMVMTKQ